MFSLIPKSVIPRKIYIVIFLAGFILMILVWSILSYGNMVNPIFLPTPFSAAQRVIALLFKERLLDDILASLGRVFSGFLLALLIGIPLGILVGLFRAVEAFIEANLSFLRFIPVAAFIPLAILWFGVSDPEKIFLIFLGVLPYTILYVGATSANVERELLEAGYVLGATKSQLITKVIIPRALPNIWDICRIEMGGAWSLLILSEIVAANSGLGYRLVLAQRFLQTENIFALIIVIGALGLILDLLFRITYRRLFPWATKVQK